VNLYSRSNPYSLHCHVGAMLVFRMLFDAHRTESVSVMDHEQAMGVFAMMILSYKLFSSVCES